MLFLGFTLFVLVVPGCGDEPKDPDPQAEPQPCPTMSDFDPTAEVARREAELAEDQPPESWWQEKHELTLLLYGNNAGKHKPCGCTAPQKGGMERLGDLRDRLARRGGGSLEAVGLGWYLAGNLEEQQEYKASFFRQAFTELGFRALLLGAEDLLSTAMSQPFEDGTTIGKPIPPINVPSTVAAAWHGSVPILRFTAKGIPIRMFSAITNETSLKLLSGAGVAPPRDQGWGSVASAVQMLTSTNYLTVVSTRGNPEGIALAMKGKGPTIIVDTSGQFGEAHIDRALVGAEQPPFVIRLEEKGKAAGVLDIDREGENSFRVSYRQVQLTPVYDKSKVSPGREAVKKMLGWYLEDVRDADLMRKFPVDATRDETKYVGSHRCAECHAAIYKDWLGSSHAHALTTLEKIDYAHDPECIRCHVVGWHRHGGGSVPVTWSRDASGFRHPDDTPYLGGVGCENCHGPGSAHVQDPWNNRLRFGDVRDAGIRDEMRKACMHCHDLDNSHNFTMHWETWYLPQIDHCEVPEELKTVVPDHLKKKYEEGR